MEAPPHLVGVWVKRIGKEQFYDKHTPSQLQAQIDALKADVFALAEYAYQQSECILLASRSAYATAWVSLCLRLGTLAQSMDEDDWLEGARVIEEEVLIAYTASRSILRHSSGHGYDLLIRPRIEGNFVVHNAQLRMLRKWLTINGTTQLGEDAAKLIASVDSLLDGETEPDPLIAANGSPPLAAFLVEGREIYPAAMADIFNSVVHQIASVEC
jgi:hypothetical protein